MTRTRELVDQVERANFCLVLLDVDNLIVAPQRSALRSQLRHSANPPAPAPNCNTWAFFFSIFTAPSSLHHSPRCCALDQESFALRTYTGICTPAGLYRPLYFCFFQLPYTFITPESTILLICLLTRDRLGLHHQI